MEELFIPMGSRGQGETGEDQSMKENENKAEIFQTLRKWSGYLPQVSLGFVQFLLSMSLFLLLVAILVQISNVHQSLQSCIWDNQRNRVSVETPKKEVLTKLAVLGPQLARLSDSLGRLCQHCPWGWELFQGSCYWFSRSQNTWKSSISACQRMNAQLVVINSEEEEIFLQSWEIRHEKRTWIGLSDHHNEGSWQWVDGSHFNISFWKPGEPNNDSDEDCVELYNDGWNDDRCLKSKAWICEKRWNPCPNF
ncbi:CD209 antigen-like protein C [Suncus etruscus]|uniref:CD209 antigen-like protein C n=1 Tax=Suncus etruscus TaxID=109475 RepID=UPI002110B72B|nr:CD209 antigen-like protein C [Suncus etruscus]